MAHLRLSRLAADEFGAIISHSLMTCLALLEMPGTLIGEAAIGAHQVGDLAGIEDGAAAGHHQGPPPG